MICYEGAHQSKALMGKAPPTRSQPYGKLVMTDADAKTKNV